MVCQVSKVAVEVTMKLEVVYQGSLLVDPAFEAGTPDPEAEIERLFDATMAELVALGAEDPSVCGTITTGTIEISVTVDAESLTSAVNAVDTMIRAALHAAGVTTAGWSTTHRFRADFHQMHVDDTGIARDDDLYV